MGKAAVNKNKLIQKPMTTMTFADTYNQLPDEYNNGVTYSNADGESDLTCTQKILITIGILTVASMVYYKFIK